MIVMCYGLADDQHAGLILVAGSILVIVVDSAHMCASATTIMERSLPGAVKSNWDAYRTATRPRPAYHVLARRNAEQRIIERRALR
jgi:hypothetical protein